MLLLWTKWALILHGQPQTCAHLPPAGLTPACITAPGLGGMCFTHLGQWAGAPQLGPGISSGEWPRDVLPKPGGRGFSHMPEGSMSLAGTFCPSQFPSGRGRRSPSYQLRPLHHCRVRRGVPGAGGWGLLIQLQCLWLCLSLMSHLACQSCSPKTSDHICLLPFLPCLCPVLHPLLCLLPGTSERSGPP